MMRLMRAFIIFCLVSLGYPLWAQDPRVNVTTEQEEVVVGQPYLLRIEVLVPTFMPKAPVFPTFETPGLIVRLPERSTSPISERVDGETWSGVRRTYRIYPTRAGVTEIPAQQVSIVYKNTDTNEDVPLTVEVPATSIRATVPEGARALDPLIIAQNIEITQNWEMSDGILASGDAVVRSLDIAVTGASALFLPPLLETAAPRSEAPSEGTQASPFLAYPEDPKVTETIDRGIMSGTRHEQVSYIAQAGGVALFPDITLRWFNIETGEVEEIVLEGRSVEVAIPPVARAPVDIATIIRWGGVVLIGVLAAWVGRRVLWPPVRARLHAMRMHYDATAYAAHRVATEHARAHNLNGLLGALDERARRGCPPGPETVDAIRALTHRVYRDSADDTKAEWRALVAALASEKPGLFAPRGPKGQDALPPLNPFTENTPKAIYLKELL